jgi:hypothetical protein
MSYNRYLYDKLYEEHRQTIQREAAQRRLLTSLPHRHGLARRAIGRLGITLVAVGSKLEQFDHHNVVAPLAGARLIPDTRIIHKPCARHE